MSVVHRISVDPTANGRGTREPCFACQLAHTKKHSKRVVLPAKRVRSWASVNTEEYPNPLSTIVSTEKVELFLCTPCRDARIGWQVIANPRMYGVNVSKRALQAWKSRLKTKQKTIIKRYFVVCLSMRCTVKGLQSEDDLLLRRRNTTCDWTLFQILSLEDKTVLDAYTCEFIRLSGCSAEVVQGILKDPSTAYMCYVHRNHSTYAQKAALNTIATKGDSRSGFCIFHGDGCTTSSSKRGRLWRLPVIDADMVVSSEAFADYEDSVAHFSNNALRACDVMGKFCCRTCLYIITEGKKGKPPVFSISMLSSEVDRLVVRCVLYALQREDIAMKSSVFSETSPTLLSAMGRMLRTAAVILGEPEGSALRMLPFQEMCRVRQRFCQPDVCSDVSQRGFDNRTVQKRLEGVLATNGIVLKKLGYKFRCYLRATEVDFLLSEMAKSAFNPLSRVGRPTLGEMKTLLSQVRKRFAEMRKRYWAGDWNLVTEISNIPHELWSDTVMMMASERRIAAWILTARNEKLSPYDLFPLRNSPCQMPQPSLEEALRRADYTRVDLLLCVRALKVIEQAVLSRSQGVGGPLTITISVSGICEVTPSFVSVLNSLGLFLSYNVTERYRQSLIAEREKLGPWGCVDMSEDIIPMLEFDNWDIKPLHAVKVDGKEMPKVNGSLLQGQTRGLKRKRSDDCTDSVNASSTWKNIMSLGSRREFISRITSPEQSLATRQFEDIVFGLVALYRCQLLGGLHGKDSEYNTSTADDFKFGSDKSPVNFRTLLLSAFEPHGGHPDVDDSLYDQHVVYVEISRDSAADILTVRRFLNLVEEQIQPWRKGKPRFIVIAGDQPSYKMFTELWLESWRLNRRSRAGISSGLVIRAEPKPYLHEWLIPFPGLLHAEKQSMYSLCKEMLDGLGLHEIASCAGLSSSQVSNFLTHSHARNNRAVLFNLCCSMLIQVTDMLVNEDSAMSEAVAALHTISCEKKVTTDNQNGATVLSRCSAYIQGNHSEKPDGVLYRETTEVVSAAVITTGQKLRAEFSKRFTN